MRKWTKEQEEYLREISPGKFDQQITDLINKKFGTNYTKSAINTKKQKLGIRSTADWRTVWTDEVIQFMIENYEGKDNIELAELLNKKFNLNTNGDRVCNVKANLIRRKGINLRTGINRGCYRKGIAPANKGKKWDEYMSKEGQEKSKTTWFQKGNISSNAVPVGTEHIRYSKGDDIGYVCVKVCDGSKNRNWVPKHRLIYEEKYGPIPEGSKVIFADGNRRNFNIENLILVSNAEELHLNKDGLRFNDKELTETGLNITKVKLRVGGIKNAKKN